MVYLVVSSIPSRFGANRADGSLDVDRAATPGEEDALLGGETTNREGTYTDLRATRGEGRSAREQSPSPGRHERRAYRRVVFCNFCSY